MYGSNKKVKKAVSERSTRMKKAATKYKKAVAMKKAGKKGSMYKRGKR